MLEETISIAVAAWRPAVRYRFAPLIAVALGTALTACATLTAAPSSLYERLGGEPVIRAVVADLIDEYAASPDGKRAFERVNLSKIKQHIEEQFCALTDGPCHYTGDTMHVAHGGLAITEREFAAIVESLRSVLNRHGIGEREKNELLRLLAPMKRDIVTAAHTGTRTTGTSV